ATSHEVAVVGLSGGGWRTVWARSDDDVTHPAPPSAPVGVEAIREAFDEISGLCRHLRQGGPAPEDLQDLSSALDEAVGIAANMLHALAQQPADDEVVFIDGVGAVRSSVKSCHDGV